MRRWPWSVSSTGSERTPGLMSIYEEPASEASGQSKGDGQHGG